MEQSKYIWRGAYHYAWYNRKSGWYYDLANKVADFCQGSTLDVSCGDGLVSKLISDRDYAVTGMDMDPVAIEMAKILVPKGKFLVKDVCQSGIRGHWDYLACLNTIEHLKEPRVILDILEKNIDKGGIIITDKADPSRPLGPAHVKEYALDELLELFNDYAPEGFESSDGQFIGVKVTK